MAKINGSDAKNNDLLRRALDYRRKMQNIPPEYNVACVRFSNGSQEVVVSKGSIGQLTPSTHSERIALAYAIKEAMDIGLIAKPAMKVKKRNF